MDENLLVTLEHSLRLTRKTQNQLILKREEIASNLEGLKREEEAIGREIESLEELARQIEKLIYDLLNRLRKNNE